MIMFCTLKAHSVSQMYEIVYLVHQLKKKSQIKRNQTLEIHPNKRASWTSHQVWSQICKIFPSVITMTSVLQRVYKDCHEYTKLRVFSFQHTSGFIDHNRCSWNLLCKTIFFFSTMMFSWRAISIVCCQHQKHSTNYTHISFQR